MRKNDLIKLLQELDGNPEIKLWNGYVCDWMDVKELQAGDLVRMSKQHYIRSCELEEQINRKDWGYRLPPEEIADLEKRHSKVCTWEVNPYVTQEDIDARRWQNKRVIYINAKLRGESSFDRQGGISY